MNSLQRPTLALGPIRTPWVGLACAVLLLGACATLPPPPLPASAPEYVVTGRMSVQYAHPASGQKEQLFGHFEWVERGKAIELTLTDPLGQGVARIISDAEQSSITLRSGEVYKGATPEALTSRTLGWPLPVTGMRQWLRAQPSSGAEVERSAAGQIVGMRQDGWIIRYPNAARDPAERPSRIDLSFASRGRQVALRLALDP